MKTVTLLSLKGGVIIQGEDHDVPLKRHLSVLLQIYIASFLLVCYKGEAYGI